jgi:hypothetical protein
MSCGMIQARKGFLVQHTPPSSDDSEPVSYSQALHSPEWQQAM